MNNLQHPVDQTQIRNHEQLLQQVDDQYWHELAHINDILHQAAEPDGTDDELVPRAILDELADDQEFDDLLEPQDVAAFFPDDDGNGAFGLDGTADDAYDFNADSITGANGAHDYIDLTVSDEEDRRDNLPSSPEPSTPSPGMTLDDCIAVFRDILPNIDFDLVRQMYIEAQNQSKVLNAAWCEATINEILENGAYPRSTQARKRKHGESGLKDSDEGEDEDIEDLGINAIEADATYANRALYLLREEFPEMPQKHIQGSLKAHKHLYPTHMALAQQHRNFHTLEDAPYVPLKKPARPSKKQALGNDPVSQQLSKELKAAQRHRDRLNNEQAQAALRAKLEADNEEWAHLSNQITECGCCFSDIPINRSISCNGDKTHPFCYECIKRLVETKIGDLQCDINCMDMSGCQAGFLRSELKRSIDGRTLDKLELLQAKESIRCAGLQDLLECPFCEFQAICEESTDVDREFRCQNPECRKVSCRLCMKETHTPMTCEENTKHTKLDAKHSVEEAMTDAMIRKCIKCKVPFCKEDGCNKMSCPRCHTLQCYVCSKEVKDYSHFDNTPFTPNETFVRRYPQKCPLYEDTAQRHKAEVETAEKKAIQRIREEHPGMTDDELKVEMSTTVPSAERRHGQPEVNRQHAPPVPHPLPQFNNQWRVPQAHEIDQWHGPWPPENDQAQQGMDLFGEDWNGQPPRRPGPLADIDGNRQPIPLLDADWNGQPVHRRADLLRNANWNRDMTDAFRRELANGNNAALLAHQPQFGHWNAQVVHPVYGQLPVAMGVAFPALHHQLFAPLEPQAVEPAPRPQLHPQPPPLPYQPYNVPPPPAFPPPPPPNELAPPPPPPRTPPWQIY